VKQRITAADQSVETGFGEPESLEKLSPLVGFKGNQFCLDLGREHHDLGTFFGGHGGQRLDDRIRKPGFELLFADIGRIHCGFCRQQVELFDEFLFVCVEIDPSHEGAVFHRTLNFFQNCDNLLFVLVAALGRLAAFFKTLFYRLEVAQD
jgi:hypothetical protein